MSTPFCNGDRNRFPRFLWLSVIYIFVVISCSSCATIITPKYTEALTGERVKFNCTAKFSTCEWHHLEVNGHSHQVVYKNGNVYRAYKDRFNVEADSGRNSILSISNVTMEDAGRYTCLENSGSHTNGNNHQVAAELVVYGMSLSINYHGITAPTAVWKTFEGVILNSSQIEVNGNVTSTLKIYYDESNIYSYVSQVKYRVNDIRPTPESNHTWSVQRQSVPSSMYTTTAWSAQTEEEQAPGPSAGCITAVVIAVISVIINVILICILIYIILKWQRCKQRLADMGCLPKPQVTEQVAEPRPGRSETQEGIEMEVKQSMLPQVPGSSA